MGETALHKAASTGSDACVEALLDQGARVDVPNNKGMTALLLVRKKRSRGVHECLLGLCEPWGRASLACCFTGCCRGIWGLRRSADSARRQSGREGQ
mmetsp:Transcript_88522/g.235570  ORF Transcript_88522/g.235570 Transcript_88522/m.235570 type:complete len:97 (+) Transcript_88522:330-620(+)